MKDLLNAYQWNSVMLALRSFEETLRQADAWLEGKEEYGILYQHRLNLSNGKRNAAQKQIAEALEQIAELARRLDLQAVEEDPDGLIHGKLTVSWANLIDTRSQKLRRFGEVDPGLAEVLDPDIDRLVQLAIDLAMLFNQNDSIPARAS